MTAVNPAHRSTPATSPAAPKASGSPAAKFRPGELIGLAVLRYPNRRLPPDDDGRRHATQYVDACALSGSDGRQRASDFLQAWCPWMRPIDRAAAIDRAFSSPRHWSPLEIGNDLSVTDAEREKARIRTFRAAWMTDEAMAAKRRAAEAARKRQGRLQERLEATLRVGRPAARVDAILKILPIGVDWWNVGAIISELERRKPIAFAALDKKSLRPAVHRAIKYGVSEGSLETRKVPGSRMSEAMEVRRGSRP